MADGSDGASFADLPDELVVRVFSYLSPLQLNRCSRVCKRWSRLFHEPSLWRCVYLSMWNKGLWDYKEDWYVGHADKIPDFDFYLHLSCGTRITPSEIKDLARMQSWDKLFSGLKNSLLKYCMGVGIRVLELSCLNYLYDVQFNIFISTCPNLEELYANYTRISLDAFRVRNPGDCLKKLRKLALSGCAHITDQTIGNLVTCLNTGDVRSTGLRSLSLSGCSELRDGSLESLSTCTELLAGLEFLDLSGCTFHSSELLKTFVYSCTKLEPENLFYCCNILTGPYEATANGCNNLDNLDRACCAQYQN